MDPAAERTRRRLVAKMPPVRRTGLRLRQGTVVAVAADRTVEVALAGSSVTVDDVPCLTSAAPRVGQSVQLLADGLDMVVIGSLADDTAHGYTPLMQHGSVDVALVGVSTATEAVVFGWEFPDVPEVLVSTQRGATKSYVTTGNAVTAAGFTARVSVLDGTNQTETIPVRWVALHDGS